MNTVIESIVVIVIGVLLGCLLAVIITNPNDAGRRRHAELCAKSAAYIEFPLDSLLYERECGAFPLEPLNDY